MKPEFQIMRQGKTYVLFAGLLDEAHRQGLKRITTTLVQIPGPDNGQVAIVAAEVETERGIFSGIGDASPQNASKAMQTCLIRMAETRSKARALRDAVNVSACSVEELAPEEAGQVAPAVRSAAPAVRSAAPAVRSARITTERPGPADRSPHSDDPATRAQVKMIQAISAQLGEEATAASLTRREATEFITGLRRRLG